MLAGCSLGMLAGLAVDNYDGQVATLAALCVSGSRSFPYWLHVHWSQLRVMHVGMILGSISVVPTWPRVRREMRSLLKGALEFATCTVTMLIGTDVGAIASQSFPATTHSAGAMFVWMRGGMLAGVALEFFHISLAATTRARLLIRMPPSPRYSITA
jgi:hypothetical protein